MERRSLFQALIGLVVAGNASAGSYEPKDKPVTRKHKVNAFDHPCPVCKEQAVAASNRIAEVAPQDNIRCFEITGVAYYHVGKPPCDLPIQKVVPIEKSTVHLQVDGQMIGRSEV